MDLPSFFQNANSKCGKGSSVCLCVWSGLAGLVWGWEILGVVLGTVPEGLSGSGHCFGLGMALEVFPGGFSGSGHCFGLALPALPSVFALGLASQKPISNKNFPQPVVWGCLGFYHRIPGGSGLEGTLQLTPSWLWAGTPSTALKPQASRGAIHPKACGKTVRKQIFI